MSLTIKIIDNESGAVLLDEHEALVLVGAIGTPDSTVQLGLSKADKSLATDTYNAGWQMMQTLQTAIQNV